MKPKVFFRTDGNQLMGLGHLIRCSALAHILKINFEIVFYIKEIPDTICAELVDKGFICCKIENENEFLDQLSRFIIVVLDGYQFNADFQKQIKAKGAKLVCIDDLHQKEFIADLIINHSPGIKPTDYAARPYTQFALGPKYAMLRPAFLEQATKERKIEKVETIMICFGGSDYKNYTKSTLQIVLDYSNFKKIIVVIGHVYCHAVSLDLIARKDRRIELYSILNEYEMLSLMLQSDLAIVPTSGILLEVIAAGCITIAGMVEVNQKFLYEHYMNAHSFIDAVDFNELDLRNAIEKSFKVNNSRHKAFDGNEGKRILKLFLQLDLNEKVTLRRANKEDFMTTYRWASNPLVRTFSFSKIKITEKEHKSWFYEKIGDPESIYLVAEIETTKVGTIRFDINGNEAVISYLIDPDYQGKGLGIILLVNGLKYVCCSENKYWHGLKLITGYVLKTNFPSIKVFEKLSFTKYEDKEKYKFEMKIL